MDQGAKPDISAQIAAALAWWRDAGVDADFADAPHSWLAEAEGVPDAAPLPVAPVLAAPPPPPRLERSGWPQELGAFAPWWLAEPLLDTGDLAGRVPPIGASGPELMVLVPQPEAGDSAGLLTGPQGRLLDGFLKAAGLSREAIYLASVLPRHHPVPDWQAAQAGGMGALALHHAILAEPERVICFGGSILPLLGHDPANSPADFTELNHEGRTIPLLAARDLAALLERPRWKALLWQRWLDWTG